MQKLIILITALAFWGCEKDPTGNENGDSELVGNWQGYIIEDGGIKEDVVFTISADIMDIHIYENLGDDEIYMTWSYSINNDASPKQIDITITEYPLSEFIGATILSIYKIEGNVLTIVFKEFDHDIRPTSFDYSDGNTNLFVLTKQ